MKRSNHLIRKGCLLEKMRVHPYGKNGNLCLNGNEKEKGKEKGMKEKQNGSEKGI